MATYPLHLWQIMSIYNQQIDWNFVKIPADKLFIIPINSHLIIVSLSRFGFETTASYE